MKSAPIPHGEQSTEPLQQEWRQRFVAWRTFLAQCACKPSRKSVHALRVLTLRLQVGMEHSLKQAADPAATRAFERWNKDAKKLRKALQPVRDADVQLSLLDHLRDRSQESDQTPLSPNCAREIDKLEERLRRERLAAVDEQVAVLGARGKRLHRLSKEMEAALASHLLPHAPSTASAALAIFAEAASSLPRLDAANLHEYRKLLKPALYLSEISAAADPLAGRLNAAFRKIQDAAGEWHDWQALAQEAGRFLPGHGQPDGLVPVLQARAKKALRRALGQCRRSMASYRKYAGKTPPSLRKKPIAAERAMPLDGDDLETGTCR